MSDSSKASRQAIERRVIIVRPGPGLQTKSWHMVAVVRAKWQGRSRCRPRPCPGLNPRLVSWDLRPGRGLSLAAGSWTLRRSEFDVADHMEVVVVDVDDFARIFVDRVCGNGQPTRVTCGVEDRAFVMSMV